MSTPKIPDETRLEWLRFLDTKPNVRVVADWCAVKADEIGWDFFELTMALSAIKKPQYAPIPDDPDPVN